MGTDVGFAVFDADNHLYETFATVADDGRAIHDALASAVCHGMLTRFPDVDLRHLDLAYRKMPNEFPEHPRLTRPAA